MPIQRWSNNIWVVQLANEPALSEDLLGVKDQAERHEPVPHLVLDLSAVSHLNSSNLSQLLRLRKLAVDSGTRLRLVGPSDSVWAVFLATGLDKIFEYTRDVSTALADLQINSN